MTRSLASRTREAAREHPFLLAGLAAGVCNYTAAARFLDVDGDSEAVATALRRFGENLDRSVDDCGARVSMHGGVGLVETGGESGGETGDPAGGDGSDDPADALLAVGGTAVVDGGGHTALLATGGVDAAALAAVLERLEATGIRPTAAGVAGDALVVVVDRRDGADALRIVEDALAAVPRIAADGE